MPNDSFAIRLREARRMRKLSMDKLVELADFVVTKQSLSRYERGVMRPHANVLSTLAKALDVSEDYFLGTNMHIDMPMLRTSFGIAATGPSQVCSVCLNARESELWRTNFLRMFMVSAHGLTIVCR